MGLKNTWFTVPSLDILKHGGGLLKTSKQTAKTTIGKASCDSAWDSTATKVNKGKDMREPCGGISRRDGGRRKLFKDLIFILY